MTETDIRNSIVLALSREGHAVFRANVGQFFTQDGRPIRTGLPVGFSDLFGFRKDDARAFFIEVKRPGCKPTPAQVNFVEQMLQRGALAGIARNVEDALLLLR